MKNNNFYHERYRPQFHFSAKKGWLNDPTGLVFYKGEYHLFYQHDINPNGRPGKNMRWGHAVSRNLISWQELPIALELSKQFGQNYSGSAIIDYQNVSGFKKGKEHPIILFFTAVKKNVFSQCCAYSNDRGRTWTRYHNNPIIRQIYKGNRDPKVFWHKEKNKWILVLWINDGFTFFSSDNLKDWKKHKSITDFYECPDIFSIPVENGKKKKWILINGNGDYKIGSFDGKLFKPETEMLTGDYGAQLYASQTWHNAPGERKIQIMWMRGGKYPSMPFNQQMSFPCELTLRKFPEGMRLCKNPVKEIRNLRETTDSLKNILIIPGKPFHSKISSNTFDISAEINFIDMAEFGRLMSIAPYYGTQHSFEIRFHNKTIKYFVEDSKISVLGKSARLPTITNKIKLRILIDKTSIEVFCNDGFVSISRCFLPKNEKTQISFFVKKGKAKVQKLTISKLKSIWV